MARCGSGLLLLEQNGWPWFESFIALLGALVRMSESQGPSEGTSDRASGYLQVSKEGFGYLRRAENSLASLKNDVFVPAALVTKMNLRAGVFLTGRSSRKQKRRQLVSVDTIMGKAVHEYGEPPQFKRLTSVDPERRLYFESNNPQSPIYRDLTLRVVDLISPMGFGQRTLICAPPRTGKTVLLHKLAQAICENHGHEAEVYVLLIDERPEEVTDIKRSLKKATVYSSTFDESPSRHCEIVEMMLEVCRRKVEMGKDVIVFIDSLTRIGRAFNVERGSTKRTLSGGLDAGALQVPRELFGAARETEGAGSLTVIATTLIDTGSKMDQVIFEEFKGTGNSEIIFRRDLADQRIFPAIDIIESATRKEAKLRPHGDEMKRVNMIRRALVKGKPKPALEGLIREINKFQTNVEFLMSLPVAPGPG
jgi:transcription termination factor Rho